MPHTLGGCPADYVEALLSFRWVVSVQAAHAQELLASWCQRGKPQAVADISAGSLACLERPFLQEYAESLAAPLLLQVCESRPSWQLCRRIMQTMQSRV